MKLYLAGPMRVHVDFNFPLFFETATRLRDRGHLVYNPAERDQAEDPNACKLSETEATNRIAHYMRHDLNAVLNLGAVAVLPGWEKSSGARLEVHTAVVCGFPVYDAVLLTHGVERRIEALAKLQDAMGNLT